MRESLSLLAPMGEVASVVGPLVRAAGWYGPNTGLHTVSMRVLNFQGRVSIQATCAVVPGDADWFSVLPDQAAYMQFPRAGFIGNAQIGFFGETATVGFNFSKNVVWVRASVDRAYLTSVFDTPLTYAMLGIVDSILINYA
jgi:hypothetical protein